MAQCFFASDLHGSISRYERLFLCITDEHPSAVFLGGDLLPGGTRLASFDPKHEDFLNGFLAESLNTIRAAMGKQYPRIFAILGNDDPRFEESSLLDMAMRDLLIYAHDRQHVFGAYQVFGYSRVPPSPFQLKDWERYDVSRYVDPGCISPEEGVRTVPTSESELRYSTIAQDLAQLTGNHDLSNAIMLFHTPPYQTHLDRAALDDKVIDYIPVDVHVGSIAVRRLIEKRQPRITLHGHVHESARITGEWRDRIGRTHCFSAAHDGPELALVRFDPDDPDSAYRELL